MKKTTAGANTSWRVRCHSIMYNTANTAGVSGMAVLGFKMLHLIMLSDLKTETETTVATHSLFVKFRLFAGDFWRKARLCFCSQSNFVVSTRYAAYFCFMYFLGLGLFFVFFVFFFVFFLPCNAFAYFS